MPTVNAEGEIESGGGIGKVSVRRVFRYLGIDTGPRRSPSACSEILKKGAPTNCAHLLESESQTLKMNSFFARPSNIKAITE